MRGTGYAALAAAGVLALAGCTARGAESAEPNQSGPPPGAVSTVSPGLVAEADLARCPVPRRRVAVKSPSLPAATLPCLGRGPDVPLAGLRGPLVVNLWASWCKPCRDEAPLFQRLYADEGRHLHVLGVATQDTSQDAALSFAAAAGLRYPSVYDADGRVLHTVRGGIGLPVTLFVDRSGAVVHRKVGPYGSLRELRADVHTYLGVRL